MQPYRLIIPAGQTLDISVGSGADYIFIEEAPTPIRVQDDIKDQDVILREGRAAKLQPFNRLRLSHDAGVSVEIVIYIGRGTEIYTSDVRGQLAIEQASLIEHSAPVAVTAVATLIAAQDTGRRYLHIRNAGANPIRLGSSLVTFAGAALELLPGEEWREEAGAGAAWYAICDAALSSSVAVMGGR